MCYYSTSCHKEFGDGSEHSQENECDYFKGGFSTKKQPKKNRSFLA